MRRPATLVLLALGAAACRDVPPVRITGDSAAAGINVDPQTIPGRVALELWTLRPGITLGEWASANLNDVVAPTDSQRITEYLGDWCAVSTRVSESAGRRVFRQAFFYAPDPPEGLTLPDSGSAEVIRDCVLGLIWVRIPVRDSANGALLADSIRVQLASVYAPDSSGVSFWGSAFWSHLGRFRKDGVEVASALRGPSPLVTRGDSAAPAHDVAAWATLPVSGVRLGPEQAPGDGPFRPPDTLSLDSAARIAGLDSALGASLLSIVTDAESGVGRGAWRPPPGDSLVRPLRRWVAAAAGLAPARRAAALYLADQVLDRTQCAFQLCQPGDSTALAPLRALGAVFTYSELGGSWAYARSWLGLARSLERDSPLGQRILLQQMAGAFDFSGTCREGAEGFRRVIENGDRYLARVPRSPITGAVHFYVAEAQRDIVALAEGAADIYADSSAYGPERAAARERALAHYRAAIVADPSAGVAAAAWRRAWWLLAGLRVRGTRFYCIYD